MTTCTLYLVRHGQSLANANDLTCGQLDSPLTNRGKEQAKDIKVLFKDIRFDDAYSSNLKRASETAEIIYGKKVPTNHHLFDLRERNFRNLEGQPEAEWKRLNREYEKKYAHLPFEQRLKYNYADFIESDQSLLTRFIASLRQIAKTHRGQTVLIASHGGNIRVTLMWLNYSNLITAGAFANAGYAKLLCDGQDFKVQKVVGVTKAQGLK